MALKQGMTLAWFIYLTSSHSFYITLDISHFGTLDNKKVAQQTQVGG